MLYAWIAVLLVPPMLAVVLFTLYFDKDFLRGVYVTLGGSVLVILALRILDLNDTFDTILDGFKTMIEPLGVLVAAFMLKEVNDALGLPAYVVQNHDATCADTDPVCADCRRHRAGWLPGPWFSMTEPYGVDEFMYFIEGGVTLTSADGSVQVISAGEAVTLPKEWTGIWDTEGCTKIWFIYSKDGSGL